MMDRHPVFEQIEKDFFEHIQEVQRFIRQPSVSVDGNGVQEMAQIVLEKIKSLGAECRLVQLKGFPEGFPIVHGYLDAGAARTVLFYELYDVQPASAEGWISPPFAGKLDDLPGQGMSVVGRGAFNSKGCLAGFLNVLEAFKRAGRGFPVNVIFMIEGEEEIGSNSLPAFIDAHQNELRKADCVYQPYFGENSRGKTVISFGFKGLVSLELTCSGGGWGGPAERDIHALHSAWIGNPAWRLVKALSTMKDEKGQILIPGFYAGISQPGAEENQLLQELEKTFDSSAILQEQGARNFMWPELWGVELLKKALYEPSLNINGIYSGYCGVGINTIIPQEACVKMDIRLVPGMKPEQVLEALRGHLDQQGYSDITLKVFNAYPGSKTLTSNPAAKALVEGVKDWAPGEVEIWPFYAGAAPHYLFSRVLGLPVAFGGLGHGGRSHSTNEYVTLEGLKLHEKGIASFMLRYGSDE